MDFDKIKYLISNHHHAAGRFIDRRRTAFFSPARLAWLVVVLAVPLLFGAKAPTTNEPVLYREGFLQVVSPDNGSVEQAKAAAKKVADAWKFDLKVMRWTHPAEMDGPLMLRLISNDRMKSEHGGLRAWAKGNRFEVRLDLIDDPNIDGTIAHELGHLQAFRALGEHEKQAPKYFLEGHGLMMNQLYADHLHIDRHRGGGNQVRGIMSITADQARTMLANEHYRVGSTEYTVMEYMGLYFVEYLRVRKGIADAVPMMGRVFEGIGRGRTYEQAFAETYDLSVKKAASEVVAYFKRTEGSPADRIKGTRLEEYLQK